MACVSTPACEQYNDEVEVAGDEGAWRLGTDMKRAALRQMAPACTDSQFEEVLEAIGECSFPSISCCLATNGTPLESCNQGCVDMYTDAEACLRAAVTANCPDATAGEATALASCNTAMGTTAYPLQPVFCGAEERLLGMPVLVAWIVLIGGGLLVLILLSFWLMRKNSSPEASFVQPDMAQPPVYYATGATA